MIRRNLSIRLRLTLWHAAVLMAILSMVSLGIYLLMRNRLESMVRSKLDISYATVEAVIINSGGDLMDIYHLGQSSMFQLIRDDKVVYRTKAWKDAQLKKSIDDKRFAPYSSWQSAEGRHYKLKMGIVPEFKYKIIFAQDATATVESIKSLAIILIAGIPGALILALLGGYLLAGRALSPVNAITKKAREITAARLSERLPVSNPHDEIGHLAAVFNNMLARLDSSFEQLRRFTADASHELRTPLTSIRSVGEVALRGPIDKKSCQEAIGSMLEETQRLTQLVNNLLILARGDSSKMKINLHTANLCALVGEVVDELQILTEEKNQTISMTLQPSVIATVDEATLRQAISNVLHNAIIYTQRGGQIEILLAKNEDGNAIIDIIDNGPGIPESERTKVFERFYRVDEARSSTKGGIGLGLSIARWAIEANKGNIVFHDKEGTGTCCRITLPAD